MTSVAGLLEEFTNQVNSDLETESAALEPFLSPHWFAVQADQRLQEIELTALTENSRAVLPGAGFVAVKGLQSDGHDYINSAVEAGAAVVFAEREVVQAGISTQVPVVVIPDLRQQRSLLASVFHGSPSTSMICVGVTGTNGKTSIAHYVAEVAQLLDLKSGYMGTIGWGSINALETAGMTTEDSCTLQARLRVLVEDSVNLAALEVSSHALDQDRVRAVSFQAAVFTNLTRDHIDYHQDFAAYFAAKLKLFAFEGLGVAVVNVDDEYGAQVADFVNNHRYVGPKPTLIECGEQAVDVGWHGLTLTKQGIAGHWLTRWGDCDFELPLFGKFSVANVAEVIGVFCALGYPLEEVVACCSKLSAVPGRMEFYRQAGWPVVVVDFAHTPDALKNALAALQAHCNGKVICVFGCGGDRDRGKRPLMTQAALAYAGEVWLTSDNPRSESTEQIFTDMLAGIGVSDGLHQCVDRAEAIEQAVKSASVEDVVLVAGKGHETYQEIDGVKHPFSDKNVIRALLAGDPGSRSSTSDGRRGSAA